MHEREEEALRRMAKLPIELQRLIVSFVPKKSRPRVPEGIQRELERLQKSPKRTDMDLKGLDDFVIK
jgi:hypothetical protein